MDNQRLFLFAALGFILLILWQQWQLDYGLAPAPATQQGVADQQGENGEQRDDVPEAAQVGKTPTVSGGETAQLPTTEGVGEESGTLVSVSTNTIDVVLSTVGGNILEVKLKKYPLSIEQPDTAFLLMGKSSKVYFIAQSGLQSASRPAPTHHAQYSVAQTDFRLDDGQRELRVPMRWSESGIEVTKTFVFRSDSHVIDIEYDLQNGSDSEWVGNQYRQLQRKGIGDEGGSMFAARAYIGGVISSEENRYEKIDFGDMADTNLKRKITGGWAAIIQHYFLAAWAPAADEANTYYTKALTDRDRYILGLYSSEAQTVAAGGSGVFTSTLYAGPKIQDDLAEVAENLNLTVDYGFLAIIAEPLFRFLQWIYSYVGNWGWSILTVTLVIKLVFYKLSEISYRSMARMRKLQPQMQALKERHGDDRSKMGQATMELYKKEKVNPLGGCLPILIQIPVFISLYWVLLESVELRQAPFILWIEDLAIKDPFYVLPLIMGATMLIQQKLNPTPVDPIQAKIFMAMPIVFTVFFAFFPAGLVLYWVANNTLSIAQQYYITRHVLAEGKK